MPDGKRLREEEAGRISPFHDLNCFVYHQNWLHKLLIASSPELVQKKSLRWQPYRSIASMYLWNAVKLKIIPDDLN